MDKKNALICNELWESIPYTPKESKQMNMVEEIFNDNPRQVKDGVRIVPPSIIKHIDSHD
jgi:hypothetical protein